jgi:chorismate dehydratase
LERKIRVGAVSYLNTKPLVYGLENGMMSEQVRIIYDYPAAIAAMLLSDEIDVGLVPVAIIPKLKEAHIITDYCIGTENEVASVCLFSEVELHKADKILLDYQSRTSAALTKLLVRDYWKLKPEYLATGTDYRQHIRGTTAGLVIGDRALSQRKISPYIYDLGSAWKDFTGLPFVFATWVSNKKLDDAFISQFNEVNKSGLENIDKVIASHPFADYDLHTYYSHNMSYRLTGDKMKGLQSFLSLIG